MDDLMNDFIAETREMLDAIAGELVAWEADPGDRARLDAIFRFVHTVKGSCGFLDLPRLARLSHAAEDVLAEVRAGRRAADAALVSAVLGVVDRIGELAQAIGSGESLPAEEDQQLIAALQPGAAGPAPAAAAGAPARGQARTIRLPIELLDRIMSGVSDLVLARNELALRLREAGHGAAVGQALERLSASVAEMREAITRTRMQRIDQLFAALPRMVRDLAAELGRTVALELEGGDVELDREMIESIRDPITHIIRNAIDHGIEPPEARHAAGKPPAGSLRISARQSGNQIVIEASDDGRGIDGDRLAAGAVESGLLTPAEAAGLSWQRKLALMFEPGLSTARTVTAISGRGVGMDVVRANVERIGGVIEVESRPGAGSRISMRVPLTLTIMPALVVSAAGQRFAIPRQAIEEIVGAGRGARVETVAGGRIATVRGRRMPLVALAALLGEAESGEAGAFVVLKPAGAAAFALAIDAAEDHQELVVKPAAPALTATGLYAGTTLPDNGRPMLLLDPAGLARAAGVAEESVARVVALPEIVAAPLAPTLLFRDLDGVERAIRLALVERIEDVASDRVWPAAGRQRIVLDGRLVSILAAAPLPERPRLRMLRIGDGTITLAYPIDEVIDIVPLGALAAPAATAGPVAGVLLARGRAVELLDAHWLLAAAAADGMEAAAAPLCLLDAATDPWTREILAPLVAAAGYRVAFAGGEGADAPDLIVTAGDGDAGGSPVIRLRGDAAEPGAAGICRYDRDGLVAALRAHRGGQRG